ncbi:Nucleoside-binding protein [Borrelia anserina BA2]|uniref:Nucleoside-binding protein n=1 Tax=Borrelia anserina BA2 TaxID=1313293 RepID=W5SP23_BORAN|nr:Nucleoside-binding protein [Borrelia anserina BA2]
MRIKIEAIEYEIVSGNILISNNLDEYNKFLDIYNPLN